MKSEKLDLVRGSGNAFRDLGIENADVLQLKAILAGEIIKALDREGWTVRAAQAHGRRYDAAPNIPTYSICTWNRRPLLRHLSAMDTISSEIHVITPSSPDAQFRQR